VSKSAVSAASNAVSSGYFLRVPATNESVVEGLKNACSLDGIEMASLDDMDPTDRQKWSKLQPSTFVAKNFTPS